MSQTFDALGRANSTTLTMDFSWTVGSTYDVAGNRTHVTHPDGVYFQMGYDGLNRLNAAWWHSPAGGYVLHSGYQYDAQGRRATLGRANSATYYGYDPAGRLSGQLQAFAQNSAANNALEGFSYNPAGQLAAQTRDNTDYSWTSHYNVNRAYTRNGLNQYSAAGGASFAHDANGNLITETVPAQGGGTVTTRYYYDVENRLVAAYRPEGTLVASLKYDPLGRLYEVSDGTQAGTTRFVHDGVNIALEYNTSNQVLRRYMWGPEADEPILWDEGSAMNCTGTRFLLRDRLGSIVAGADCGGARVFANRYDEYGLPQRTNPASGQSANVGRFQYTGQAWIEELGLYYYKARFYSPTLGRFMQTDPIGYEDGINWYDYVGGDPVNKVDPTGLVGDDWRDQPSFLRESFSFDYRDRPDYNFQLSPSAAEIQPTPCLSVNEDCFGSAREKFWWARDIWEKLFGPDDPKAREWDHARIKSHSDMCKQQKGDEPANDAISATQMADALKKGNSPLVRSQRSAGRWEIAKFVVGKIAC